VFVEIAATDTLVRTLTTFAISTIMIV